MSGRPIVVASNRGPVTFTRGSDGSLVERRGVGGLVTAVRGALGGHEASWICAAMSEEDRARAAAGRTEVGWAGNDVHVRFVDIAEDTYRAHYDGFANRVLWFAMHRLLDAHDVLGEHGSNWRAHQDVAAAFTEAVLAEAGSDAIALPQDYHLALVPGLLRAGRSDLPIGLFWHIPFCEPDGLALVPDAWTRALLRGMLGADQIGFHARRWAANFRACCAAILGAAIDGDDVVHEHGRTRVRVFPLGVDAESLRAHAARPSVRDKVAELDEVVGDRRLLLRADRTDPTKNIVRGLRAYGVLLEQRPDLHGRVVHAALLSPSRAGIPEYDASLQAVHATADAINERYATADWLPLILDVANDFERTLAGYLRYDVLLVNPVSDGMNLVAREGPLVNERDGVLVLSHNAGAAEQLGDAALMIDPFDIDATARALARAVDMPPAERKAHAAAVRAAAPGRAPADWLEDQIAGLTG